MTITIHNPYAGASPKSTWLKGNLHCHSTASDGELSPQEVVDTYADCGYGFLMLSDHDWLVDPAPLDPRGMVLLPGYEISANGPHILHVGTLERLDPLPDRQQNIDAIIKGGGLAIVCHPNWQEHFNHCPQPLLEQWQGYAGIEIANGVCMILPGSGYALDRWDRLLGQGRRVWGYGNDDAHRQSRMGTMAWNVALAERTPESVLDALRSGRFYVSTGVTIETIEVEFDIIRIVAPNAQRIVVYADYQSRVEYIDGPECNLIVADEYPWQYARFECLGAGGAAAWTQPFFVERDAPSGA